MAELPTGTVTFLFTDIEGSTTRCEQHRAAMQAALARHDAIRIAAIKGHDGVVCKPMGEAFSAVCATTKLTTPLGGLSSAAPSYAGTVLCTAIVAAMLLVEQGWWLRRIWLRVLHG